MLYAHTLPNQPPEKWQPLDTHLRNVATLAAKFATPFNSADWAYNAGILHETGIYSLVLSLYSGDF